VHGPSSHIVPRRISSAINCDLPRLVLEKAFLNERVSTVGIPDDDVKVGRHDPVDARLDFCVQTTDGDRSGNENRRHGSLPRHRGGASTDDDTIIGFDTQAPGRRRRAKPPAAGHAPGMPDAVIAGIAAAHERVIVTRNTKHFLPFGIAVLSPQEAVEGDGA